MRIMILVCVVASGLLPSSVHAQRRPAPDDNSRYAQAFRLLYPEESARDRARRAIQLINPGEELDELSTGELALLCKAYNELGDMEKQYEGARMLWERQPGSPLASQWMLNSLQARLFEENNQPVIDFVDNAIKNGHGNRRELLLLKAKAIILRKTELSIEERREQAEALIVEAYSQPIRPIRGAPIATYVFDNLDVSLCLDSVLTRFFSEKELKDLKVKIEEARGQKREKKG